MNTMLELTREQTHPPIALTNKGLLDRAALHFGLALIRWARRSELRHSQRLAQQQERSARHFELEKLRVELADRRARLDVHLLFRSLQ